MSQRSEGHDLNVDWWSVGVLTIELLTGQSPFSRDGEESNQSVISERIQNEPPNIPPTVCCIFFSSFFFCLLKKTFLQIGRRAKDLILKLLEKSPSKRLGSARDSEDLKTHDFFKSINWEKLQQKRYRAPIKPSLKSPEDVSHFADDFTSQKAEDRPAEKPTHINASHFFRGKIVTRFIGKMFNFYIYYVFRFIGYSFVSPELMKSKEFITNNPKERTERPNLKDILELQRIVSSSFDIHS